MSITMPEIVETEPSTSKLSPETPPQRTPEAEIARAKSLSNSSLESIATNAFLAEPLGDIPGNQQVPRRPDTPPSDSIREELTIGAERLESEIDSLELEDSQGKSDKSRASFEGLKSRYKNNINDLKSKHQVVVSQLEEAQARLSELSPLANEVKTLRGDAQMVATLKSENESLRARNSELSIYEKKHNLLGNPEVQQTLVQPMEAHESKASEILVGALGDEVEAGRLWSKLISTDNDYEINRMISSNGITDLNAISLKSHINNYRGLNEDLNQLGDPQFIDNAISQMTGRSRVRSDEKAKNTFSMVRDQFSDHIKELKESEINREHNLLVYDQTVEKANNDFQTLRDIIDPSYSDNEKVLNFLARTSLINSAYQATHSANSKLIKEVAELKSLVKELRSPVEGSQTQEKVSPSQANGLDDFKRGAAVSIDDILGGVRRDLGR